MRMEMQQSMRLEQRQILSQQLIQNMQLLQVPIMQLNELIMQEIEQNPALDLKEHIEDSSPREEAPAPVTTAEPPETPSEAESDRIDILKEIDDQRDYQRAARPTIRARSLDDDRADFIQSLSADSVSLQQHLLAQLKDADVSDELRLIVENLINSLGERGYLRISPQDSATILSSAYTGVDYDDLLELVKGDPDRYSVEAIIKVLEPRYPDTPQEELMERVEADMKHYTREALAQMFGRTIPNKTRDELLALVDKGIEVVQGFDPPGVGAIDTRECFLLQLNPTHADYPRQKFLVEHCLDDIIHNRIPKIAREVMENPSAQAVFGWNASLDPEEAIEEIKYTVQDITALNTSPGRNFSGEKAAVVIPDIIIKMIDGEMEITLEESYLPPVAINRSVVELARKGSKLTDEERNFIRKKLESAKRIIQAIEQRRTTLVRITRRLIERQAEFFDRGVEALKPLTMTELANELSVHVSTVARAVKDKYVQTPRGVYSLRFFFAAAAPSKPQNPYAPMPTNGPTEDPRTRKSVIERIREIVLSENKKKPLSDKQIVDKLEEMHRIKLKRRTVAKYREEAAILSSRFRKQF